MAQIGIKARLVALILLDHLSCVGQFDGGAPVRPRVVDPGAGVKERGARDAIRLEQRQPRRIDLHGPRMSKSDGTGVLAVLFSFFLGGC